MPATLESTPKHKPGFIGGLNFDHPGGLVIKGGRELGTTVDKFGKPMMVDGLQVAMYKDKPGEYYALNGRRVSEAIAAKAGFDVELMRKRQKRMSFVADSAARFDAENAITTSRNVIAEREGVQVVQIGGQEKYVLEDVSDKDAPPFNLTPGRYLSRAEAIRELGVFFGDAVSDGNQAVADFAGKPAPPEFRKPAKP